MSTLNDSSTHAAEPKKATETQFINIRKLLSNDYAEIIEQIRRCPLEVLNKDEGYFLRTMVRDKNRQRLEKLGSSFRFGVPEADARRIFIDEHTYDKAQGILEREMVILDELRKELGIYVPRRANNNQYFRLANVFAYMNGLAEEVMELKGEVNTSTKTTLARIKFYVTMRKKQVEISVNAPVLCQDVQKWYGVEGRFRERFTDEEAERLFEAEKDKYFELRRELELPDLVGEEIRKLTKRHWDFYDVFPCSPRGPHATGCLACEGNVVLDLHAWDER